VRYSPPPGAVVLPAAVAIPRFVPSQPSNCKPKSRYEENDAEGSYDIVGRQ
jgi:hypothetical protein